MIVVDTSVWACWFNGETGPHADRLEAALLDRELIGVPPIVLTEVLMGFRTDRGYRRARDLLVALPSLALDCHGHVEAAALYRRLRRAGVTVRGAADCVIAQTCIAARAELLSSDSDFRQIARLSTLRLWLPG